MTIRDRASMRLRVEAERSGQRGEAGTHVLALVDQAMHAARAGRGIERDVGVVGGVSWRLHCHPANPGLVELSIAEVGSRISLDRADLPKIDPARLTQRLENAVAKLPAALDDTIAEVEVLDAETGAAHNRLTSRFTGQDDLARLEAELAALNTDLANDGDDIRGRRRPPAPGR